MKPFTHKVIQVVHQIPTGKVMSYGQVAQAAGSPRGARQVVRILHTMSNAYDLPWHRVVNAQGRIVLKDAEEASTQKERLISEGIQVDWTGQMDLQKYRYIPRIDWDIEDS